VVFRCVCCFPFSLPYPFLFSLSLSELWKEAVVVGSLGVRRVALRPKEACLGSLAQRKLVWGFSYPKLV
jgi:hypothetical protein